LLKIVLLTLIHQELPKPERTIILLCYNGCMPLVNVYYTEDSREILLNELSLELKKFIASKLSCGEIDLKSEEVSVRLIKPAGSMIAPIELEIFAHEFEERVRKQDEICNEVRKFLLNKIPNVEDIRVWLILSQLGHSWG